MSLGGRRCVLEDDLERVRKGAGCCLLGGWEMGSSRLKGKRPRHIEAYIAIVAPRGIQKI